MSFFTDISFTHPWFGLLAVAPLALFILNKVWFKKKPALAFSSLQLISFPGSWRTRTIFMPPLFFLLSWLVLVLAMVGPRLGHEETEITTQGIAIAMVMDVSGSMAEKDMEIPKSGRPQTISRLKMVEEVFASFVQGDESSGLEGRVNDLISLVTFDTYVEELCPLTLDHDFMIGLMRDTVISVETLSERLRTGAQQSNPQNPPSLSGTALYEGVALAADVLKQSERSIKSGKNEGEGNYSIKSKVMIVLTDGEDNKSQITVDEAVKVAKEFGVKVYSIAVHGDKTFETTIFGQRIRSSKQKFDDTPLKTMATETGGRFFSASDPKSLEEIYAEIDKLEKAEIDRQVTMEYSPVHRPLLMLGASLLALALVLSQTLYRVLP